MDAALSAHASNIREGKLPATCAILLAIPESYKRAIAAETREPPSASVVSPTSIGTDGSPSTRPDSSEARSKEARQEMPHFLRIQLPAWLKTVERSPNQSVPATGSLDRPSQTDPIWTITAAQRGPIPVTRLSGEVEWIDPTAQEPDDAVLTPEDKRRIADVTLNGRSELRTEIEKLFGGPDWPLACVIVEPFRRYAAKVFDANAAAYRNASSVEARDSDRVLNAMARNLLSDVFGSEWESSPGEKVTRTDWQSSTEGWKGREIVVLAGNDSDKDCLYHQLVGDAIMYRYRFHDVPPPPIPGEPPGINLSNLEWWQYIGLKERHNLAMAIKPYIEDRVAHWRFIYGPTSSAIPDSAARAAEVDVSRQGAEQPQPNTRKGDGTLLDQKRLVSFATAEQYLGISDRQRQKLTKSGALKVEGQGQNRKITSESLRIYLPPEIPN
jgi:hypothetical protein